MTTSMGARHRPLRVLCLHGYGTNARVMAHQMRGLRGALLAALDTNTDIDTAEAPIEFHYVDGPWPADAEMDPAIRRRHAQDAPFYAWWHAHRAAPEELPADAAPSLRWSWVFEGYDATLAHLRRALEALGPVDVVVGFSQGAILATVFAMAELQQRHRRWWRLCVCVGGIEVRGIQARGLFETPDGRRILVPGPSIHVLGTEDPFYRDAQRLVESYDPHPPTPRRGDSGRRVFLHDGGHRFPSVTRHAGLYQDIAAAVLELVDDRRAEEPHAKL